MPDFSGPQQPTAVAEWEMRYQKTLCELMQGILEWGLTVAHTLSPSVAPVAPDEIVQRAMKQAEEARTQYLIAIEEQRSFLEQREKDAIRVHERLMKIARAIGPEEEPGAAEPMTGDAGQFVARVEAQVAELEKKLARSKAWAR